MKTRAPSSEGRFAYEGLDRVIHERARLSVLTSLISSPKGVTFGELKQLCSLTDGNLSRHLRVLRRCGLVEGGGVDHDARVRLYRLRPEPFRNLRAWLEHVEAFWSGQLAAFKAHAERTRRGRRRP